MSFLGSFSFALSHTHSAFTSLMSQDWTTAVSELLEGCQMLVGENLSRVGALRKLRGDLTRMSRWELLALRGC